jgi:hypothetical protein
VKSFKTEQRHFSKRIYLEITLQPSQWFTPVILAALEAEIERIEV